MCLVLFVVSKILDSSELLCLLEMGVEYYLVQYVSEKDFGVEGRGATHKIGNGGRVEPENVIHVNIVVNLPVTAVAATASV